MYYKGYYAHVKFDESSKVFWGAVVGLKDIISFEGSSVSELEKAFRESIDDYLAWCKELGDEPEKIYSGNLRLRMEPTLHAQLAREAAMKNISLNDLILRKLTTEK